MVFFVIRLYRGFDSISNACALTGRSKGGLNGRSVISLVKNDKSASGMFVLVSIIGGVAAVILVLGKSAMWPIGIIIGGGLFFGSSIFDRFKVITSDPQSAALPQPNFNYAEVKMNELKVSQKDDEVLFTKNLSACVAIGVGHKFDKRTQIFAERRMAHLLGGNVYHNLLMSEKLFENLEKDASFVVVFGWLYQRNSISDRQVLKELYYYCRKKAIAWNSREIQCVYSSYICPGEQDAIPGTVKLFPNGDVASIDDKGFNRQQYYENVSAVVLRRKFEESFNSLS